MIEFGDFYRLIAKGPLSPWLDILPAQLSAWQRESLHGKFKTWFNAVEHLPQLTPTTLDLHSGVRAEMSPPISAGQREGMENMLRAPDALAQRPLLAIWVGDRYRMAFRLEVATGLAPYQPIGRPYYSGCRLRQRLPPVAHDW